MSVNENFDDITKFLNDNCINKLLSSILNDELLIFNNNDLITIYTFIYNKCLEDKNKIYFNFFYQYYKNTIISFINSLLITVNDKNILFTIENHFKKFKFLVKNLSIMFRILNKHYLLNNNCLNNSSTDLENTAYLLFKNNYLESLQNIIIKYIYNDYLIHKNYNLDLAFNKFLSINRFLNLELNELYLNCYYDMIIKFYSQKLNHFDSFETFYDNYNNILQHENEILKPVLHDNNLNLNNIILKIFEYTNYKEILKEIINNIFTNKNINHNLDYLNKFKLIDKNTTILFFQLELNKIPDYHFIQQITFLIHLIQDNTMIEIIKKIFNQKINENINILNSLIEYLYKDYFTNNYYNIINLLEDYEKFANLYHEKLYQNSIKFNINLNNEKIIYSILKSKIKSKYLYKIESLINDLIQSDDFNNKLSNNSNIVIYSKLNNNIFLKNIILPYDIEQIINIINNQYNNLYNNRKINIDLFKSRINCIMNYKNCKYDLELSFIQYIILKYIINNNGINVNTILQKLNISWEYLGPLLHSLTINNQNVLLKTGQNNMIDKENDLFYFNKNFKIQEKSIFKMPILNKKDIHENKINDKEQKYLLQCKIMKLIKKYSKIELKNIFKELSMYENNLIQENLDYLVDLDYIELSNNYYTYI
jgi:hypothetical protein